jgi:hypothetical protein
MWRLMRFVAATLPLIILPAVAGQFFSDWPDAIICRLKPLGDAEGYAVFVISVVTKANNVCPAGFPKGEYSATYVRLHYHAQNAAGQLTVEGDGLLEFCGPTVNQAYAWAAPNYTLDCDAGVTIEQLNNRKQTRNYSK